MKLSNKLNPKQQTSLVSTLTAHYGDDGLARIIESAKQVSGITKEASDTAAFAKRLQTEQMYRWLENRETPEDVFDLLKLNKAGYKIFDKPEVNSWMNKSPSSESIAKRLDTELLLNWNKNGDAPGTVFTLLKLNKAGDKLFDSPLLPTWQKYIAYFREKNPRQRVNELSILRKHFSDATLSKMLLEAEKIPSKKALASDLLDDLVIRWMASETVPTKVYSWLRVEGTAENSVARGLYDSYLKFYKQHVPDVAT
ncbi:hypothetical protein PF005_g12756 [Phytophthora fragariae]|uniref:RxLR effector PexRD54 WY domain-containing protein n=1 Tax=Phytophthora fragariae TaxID=53985 RepID=A0A6A3Y0Z3_9STRA|nr:hypothetical protein PF005_g12756 [Phytophthora fragariae]